MFQRNFHRNMAISTLHFEIDRAFRAKGIEIAFPQQDLHLRSVDGDAARLLGGQVTGRQVLPPHQNLSDTQN